MRREQLRALGLGLFFAAVTGVALAVGVLAAGWIAWWVLNP